MRVFVTGGTGFIGSRVVRELVGRGFKVRCLVRPTSRLQRLGGLDVELVTGDITDSSGLAAAASGCRACIHLAAVSGWSSHARSDLKDIIVGGTARLVDALRASSVTRLIYVSSSAAIDGTHIPQLLDERSSFSLQGSDLTYAIAKHRAEQLASAAARSDFEVVVVNPAETYGPDDDDWITAGSIRDALTGMPPLAVHGGTSLAHVDDVAGGIVAALERGRSGERYILGGDNLTIAEIVTLVHEIAGIGKPVVTVPFWTLRLAVAASRACGFKPPVEPAVLGYLCRYWFMDSSKAQRELGYRPRSARDTLAPVVRWILSQARPSTTPAAINAIAARRKLPFLASKKPGWRDVALRSR